MGGEVGRARTSQRLCCIPRPPSSHSPSLAYMHVSSQMDGTFGGDPGGAGAAGGASKGMAGGGDAGSGGGGGGGRGLLSCEQNPEKCSMTAWRLFPR